MTEQKPVHVFWRIGFLGLRCCLCGLMIRAAVHHRAGAAGRTRRLEGAGGPPLVSMARNPGPNSKDQPCGGGKIRDVGAGRLGRIGVGGGDERSTPLKEPRPPAKLARTRPQRKFDRPKKKKTYENATRSNRNEIEAGRKKRERPRSSRSKAREGKGGCWIL